MSYLICLPSIYEPYTDACLAGLKAPSGQVLVVDNTSGNRGVPASWNLGVTAVTSLGYDWLVLLSAAVRFGKPGGLDFLDRLDEHPDAWVVEAGAGHVERYHHGQFVCGLGWHLIAFRRSTLVTVGQFDTLWAPAYFEDIDYSWRIRLASGRRWWTNAMLWPKLDPVDAWVETQGHGEKLGRVAVMPGHEQVARYVAKWGGSSGSEQYDHPYNRYDLDWTYTGPPP